MKHLSILSGLLASAAMLNAPTSLSIDTFKSGWIPSANAQEVKIGYTNIELIFAIKSPTGEDQTIASTISEPSATRLTIPLPAESMNGADRLSFKSPCGRTQVNIRQLGESGEAVKIGETDIRARAFMQNDGDVLLRFKANDGAQNDLNTCIEGLIFEEPFEGPAPDTLDLESEYSERTAESGGDETSGFELADGSILRLIGLKTNSIQGPLAGTQTTSSSNTQFGGKEPTLQIGRLRFAETNRGDIRLVANASTTDPDAKLTLNGVVTDRANAMPLVVLSAETPKFLGRTFKSLVTFADPESVAGMEYHVEATLLNTSGEEVGFIEKLIRAGVNLDEDQSGDLLSNGGVTTFSNVETIELALDLTPNGTGEDFTLNANVFQSESDEVAQLIVAISPQDGGSDADPADLKLDFVESCARWVVRGNAGTADVKETGISYNLAVSDGMQDVISLGGDLGDFPADIQEGKGKGTKRSTTTCGARPELQ
ncbi:hypothetical protein [Litorimonas sp. WD9-15]|uniref:hypothetical protein n=1 Tax=Litorimonas sp. WD9-15 TaxID=3418716 RepID=UPI003CFD059D